MKPLDQMPGHTASGGAGLPDRRDGREDWVRLRTLVLLRWMAIAGQLAALIVANRHFGITLNLPACLVVIGLSIGVNLLSGLLPAPSRRLSASETLAILMFDTAQLSALLYLTGGLNNPFALLLLVPATIAATALSDRATAIVGSQAIATVTLLFWTYHPLVTEAGHVVRVPPIFGFGFWLAIVVGVLFLSLYARRVSNEIHAMGDALLATQLALAREQKLTDLSGVVAAAAHELGTPLATIKLASSELADELADRPDLRHDAELIRAQADRCRDILRSMGRAGKDDLHLRAAPLAAVVQEAAEPHANRRVPIRFSLPPGRAADQPFIARRPEVIHGLRNLIQNAVDFAGTTVWADVDWTDNRIEVVIADDGPGYPAHLIDRIGDPYMHSRAAGGAEGDGRGAYEGMGMGLFIAKTLLERTGAHLEFANGSDPFLTDRETPSRSGAIVRVRWPRAMIAADPRAAHGENAPIPG